MITLLNFSKKIKLSIILMLMLLLPMLSFAGNHITSPSVFGIRLEFILFAMILIGVAVFHHKTFWVALIGLTVIISFKLIFDSEFVPYDHFFGKDYSFTEQIITPEMRQGEWSTIINLLGLLLGFSVLARLFRDSGVPEVITKFLPSDWKAPFILLIFVAILSCFLDNIAAALIGGAIAMVVFKNKVHIGYIAAIVAASNAGGSGSVVGDTTTTMMWIDGVSALDVTHAFIAAIGAIAFFGWFAAKQQHKFQPIEKVFKGKHEIMWSNVILVCLMLIGAIFGNIMFDMPASGVWVAIIIGITFCKVPWKEIPEALKGTIFLLCLVTCASLMPVETLPDASWTSAFYLGFVSAVFDNIPLTKLCLEQGHFDWGILAYSVGFGGSMIWFGSSAGVAITNEFPEARDVFQWLKKGWHISVAYIIGFFILFFLRGWEPTSNKKHTEPAINCIGKKCSVAQKAKSQSIYKFTIKD